MKVNKYHSEHYQTLQDINRYRTINDVKYLLMSAENSMREAGLTPTQIKTYSAFFSFQFLVAGRVSEVYDTKLKDIYIKKESNQLFIYIILPNRKNRKETKKIGIIWYKNPAEQYFIKKIIEYIYSRYVMLGFKKEDFKKILFKKLPEAESVIVNEPLFVNPKPITKKKLYRMLIFNVFTKYFGINSHFVRSIRASIMVNQYNFSAKELQKFLGHSSIVSSEPYINLDFRKIKYKLVSENVI